MNDRHLQRFFGSAVCLLLLIISASALIAQAVEHPEWPGKGQLFVGTCYQPVDRTPAQIRSDIALMRAAGFTMARMGDLAWDSFEPSEDHFEFAWFDSILDQMQAAGIHVLLDISGLPAPVWLHRKYPGVNIVSSDGTTLRPAERYMDNTADPDYRRSVLHFADVLTKRYTHHPALIAVGYDNEIGNGFMSYAAADRERFIAWLKTRYATVDELNKGWATQRWSRHLNSFEDVELPYGDGPGPPERYLDWRRFWSDQAIANLEDLDAVRRRNAPNLPAASNLWDTASHRGFDYLSTYKNYVTYGTEGFYPGDPLHATLGVLLTKGDLSTPTWFNEFVTGGSGSYGGPKGILRMWAYLGLIDYGQTFLAWTFNTHRGGEEQALFGLLDHDGTPSWKYFEFQRIATEFAKLQRLGFPRFHTPEVAIAYSFDSAMASNPPKNSSNSARAYFTTAYQEQVASALVPFFEDNIDVATVNVGHADLSGYKLVVVPADYVMDEASAGAIRRYVERGGTVVMTAFSAKVDEHSQWFETPLPGRLSDVFGLRTGEFYRPPVLPELKFQDQTVKATIPFYEVLEPKTASVIAAFTNTAEESAAITLNRFGKGRAIYVALPAQASILRPLMRRLESELGIATGPKTPEGVYARVVEGRTLYVNTTGEEKMVALGGGAWLGLLTQRSYTGALHLKAYDVDLVEPVTQ